MKSRYRSWSASCALAAAATLAHAHGAAGAADASAWFGPACAASPAISSSEKLLLLTARTSPNEAGRDVRILQTADQQLWSDKADLDAWHLSSPKQTIERRGRQWYALGAIEGLRYRYDDCTQSLWLDLSRTRRESTAYDLNKLRSRAELSPVDPGGYLNLDLQYQDTNRASGRFSGVAELGVFGIASGYGNTSLLADEDRITRLDSQWSIDDPERLLRLSLGDSILRPSQFGLPSRFGGLQYGTAFGLRPDIVTFPRPTLSGDAALPSSVDVYVNQSLRARQDVAAGPFTLDNVPAVVGLDQVQIVTTDVLGRQQVVSYPLYSAQTLLAPGLSDFTVEAGWLRRDYGFYSDHYGPFASSATWRRGISDQLTVELRGEAAHNRALLSQGADWLLPGFGVFSAGYAASRANGSAGNAGSIGFQRITRVWSFSLKSYRADAEFVRTGEDFDPQRASDLASVGLALGRTGSLSVNHVRQQRRVSGNSTIDSIGYSVTPWRNLFVTANWSEIRTPQRDYLAALLFGYQFGRSHSAFANAQRSRNGDLRQQYLLQKNLEGTLGYAYQASISEGDFSQKRWQGDWVTTRGSASIEASQFGDTEGYRLGYQTGFALLKDDAFWSRPINGSFAVVDTSGVGGVSVLYEERPIGSTNASGRLLVPDLRAYEQNRLRIDELGVPLAAAIDTIARTVVLPTRGGTYVSFPIQRTRSARLRLHQADGTPVPAGAKLRVDGSESLPVGYGGAVYLESVSEKSTLSAQWKEQQCHAVIPADLPSGKRVDVLCESAKSTPSPSPVRLRLATAFTSWNAQITPQPSMKSERPRGDASSFATPTRSAP